MKKFLLLFVFISVLSACKSDEDKCIAVVDEFLTTIHDRTKTFNNDLVTEDYGKFMSDKSYYSSKDWDLSAKQEDDTTMVVMSKTNTYNSFGRPTELIQKFALTDRYGGWKIEETYNLIAAELDFDIVDTRWEFFWDRQKEVILEHLQENLHLEVITPGYGNQWSSSVRGNLRLVNDSELDIKWIKILIEHFDRNGVSVNTDRVYVRDYVRKGGYREFEWVTLDCANCTRQTYKINFIKESH